MIENLNYSDVPTGFMHCLNASCQWADSCLRYQSSRFVPEDCKAFRILNPSYCSAVSAGRKCSEYLSDEGTLHPFGIEHLYDAIPYAVAMRIKERLIAHYGKNIYYRFNRSERYFTPEDQEFVRSAFKQFGVEEEPEYDGWSMVYQWGRISK